VGRSLGTIHGVAAPVIDYTGTYDFALTPEDLWDAIEHFEKFPGWWGWLHEFRLEGVGLAAGSVLHGVVVPPLPYRMRIRVDILECVRYRSIDAAVHGDLEGDARLRMSPSPPGATIEVAWNIEMMQTPMRLASRFAHPLLRFGHDRVVDITVAGFRRNVERDADRSPAAGPVDPQGEVADNLREAGDHLREAGDGKGSGEEHDGPRHG
jgi:hypothetical protein